MKPDSKPSRWRAGLFAAAAGIALLLTQPIAPAEAQSLGVGKAAPTFTLKTADGKTVNTQNFRDKRAQLLVFWASW